MAKRFSGNLQITVEYTGKSDASGRGEYRGAVYIPGYGEWRFDQLCVHPVGAYDSPKSYDRVAEAAIDFGGYYGNGNRDDVPKWAPNEIFAEAIQSNQEFGWEDTPQMAGVFVGDNAIVFRSMKIQNHFRQEISQDRARPYLRLIHGGATNAA